MRRAKFKALLAKALSRLPIEFRNRLENVDIVVEDWPPPEQLVKAGLHDQMDLLGLYEGIPVTERSAHYGMVVPDKITIFQKPIEAQCLSDQEIEEEIQAVLYHEVAHYFGISDERLDLIEGNREKSTLDGVGSKDVEER
jgi:predicted Zn-dependent protease with MMP-like domain